MYGGLSGKIAGFSNAVQGTQPGEGKVSMAEGKYSEKSGEPIRNVSGNISFQIAGDFGVGGRVVIEVSNGGNVYETANDRRRNSALAATFRHNSNQIRT